MIEKKLFTVVLVFALAISVVSAVQPFGATVDVEKSERALADVAGNLNAFAGNVTELDVTGFSPTQSWQGYFGNVSGTIQLADASDHVMYNWSLASPQGEIYASRNDSVKWQYIQCFNFSADGSYDADGDMANAGGTSHRGMNLVQLESAYNILSDDKDGVDETFSLAGTHESGEGYTHSMFYTNNLQFSAGECLSTHLFGMNGDINDTRFEEVLLYDPVSQQPVFVSLLNEESINGFDGSDRDFEMLVLEDGHGVNTATTTYYFYVELE